MGNYNPRSARQERNIKSSMKNGSLISIYTVKIIFIELSQKSNSQENIKHKYLKYPRQLVGIIPY
ncbi:MAG: hypothetical protein F6K17_03655 [Okeania sp. SIO3C4]|nr:hypothetical protein [Okeania sp. SIO3B3]NER01789.1 hypothetical protein [Okeania sp. SIO3C4]